MAQKAGKTIRAPAFFTTQTDHQAAIGGRLGGLHRRYLEFRTARRRLSHGPESGQNNQGPRVFHHPDGSSGGHRRKAWRASPTLPRIPDGSPAIEPWPRTRSKQSGPRRFSSPRRIIRRPSAEGLEGFTDATSNSGRLAGD